jgi:hypothetical protein
MQSKNQMQVELEYNMLIYNKLQKVKGTEIAIRSEQ